MLPLLSKMGCERQQSTNTEQRQLRENDDYSSGLHSSILLSHSDGMRCQLVSDVVFRLHLNSQMTDAATELQYSRDRLLPHANWLFYPIDCRRGLSADEALLVAYKPRVDLGLNLHHNLFLLRIHRHR